MITFRQDRSDDFEGEIRKIFEKKLADALRKEGIQGVEISVDKDHHITITGDEDAVRRAHEVVAKLR